MSYDLNHFWEGDPPAETIRDGIIDQLLVAMRAGLVKSINCLTSAEVKELSKRRICATPGCWKEIKTVGDRCEDCLVETYPRTASPSDIPRARRHRKSSNIVD